MSEVSRVQLLDLLAPLLENKAVTRLHPEGIELYVQVWELVETLRTPGCVLDLAQKHVLDEFLDLPQMHSAVTSTERKSINMCVSGLLTAAGASASAPVVLTDMDRKELHALYTELTRLLSLYRFEDEDLRCIKELMQKFRDSSGGFFPTHEDLRSMHILFSSKRAREIMVKTENRVGIAMLSRARELIARLLSGVTPGGKRSKSRSRSKSRKAKRSQRKRTRSTRHRKQTN